MDVGTHGHQTKWEEEEEEEEVFSDVVLCFCVVLVLWLQGMEESLEYLKYYTLLYAYVASKEKRAT